MGLKSIKKGLFSLVFYSDLKGKFCIAPQTSHILLVTRPVTLGHFWGFWEAKLAMRGLGNGAKIDQKCAF